MNRRQYLATTAVVASVSLSGCSALEEEVSLRNPTEDRDSTWTQFTHEYRDEELVRVSFRERSNTSSTYQLQTTISQPTETSIERTRFRFRPESEDLGPDSMFVQPLRTHLYDEFDTYREDGWIVVEALDHGEGTVSYQVLAHQTIGDDEPGPLEVDYEIVFSDDDFFETTYTARDRTTVQFE
ncbi:hypothetical protein [Natronobacterium texcoconense]|uniref:DUF8121 domain-containing protein n=1 Tax=Natronobacterium texcoconense TaxID=1095778 RepID=A0A1H1IY39_NATTX|nr:hypothetical protein [Natronobacterium texcoconense]SDR42637.1 hypothetical protein SAMN04489842_3914 [Natronobacterium texcoconense]